MINRLAVAAMFAAALLLTLSQPAFAQTYGEITGTVADGTGAVIPGATVTVTNEATNVAREIQTNESGTYSVPFLNPATYTIRAELEGFKASEQRGLILQVSDVARVNFAMEIGVVTETVEVEGSAPLLQTESTSLGQVIEQQRIVELPINGRNYLNLVKLSTNVSAEQGTGGQANSRQGGERSNQSISVSGQRQQYNRFTLDGVENTDPNFNTFVVRPSVDALQEFKVQTGVYSAEFGKATSQINVTTKAGTNQFHGSIFEFLRNDAIQARTWQQHGEKDPFRRNQFGFTATGPIIKNKLFFMANYEGFRERRSGFAQATVADQAMRNGDFSNPNLQGVWDPSTLRPNPNGGGFISDPFVNQQIPTTRFKQPFVQLQEFYPLPTIAGAVVGASANNYTRNTPEPLDWDQFTARIDFAENGNSQWFGRYSFGDELLTDGRNFESQDERIVTRVHQYMLSNIRTFSQSFVNELRLGANLFDNSKLTFFNGVRDVTSELGIPGLNSPIEAAWGSPQVGMSGGSVAGWGERTGGPFINFNRTFQILDNVSVLRGNHSIKFGGEIADRRYNQVGNQFHRGNLSFEAGFTGDPQDLANTGEAFASGLLGWMQEATRAAGIANVQFRQKSFALYVEDSWKVRQNITLNLGMRYENTPPWKDRYRGIMNIRMSCPGVDATGIDEDCPIPTIVRPGSGDFHEGLGFHLADSVPKATGDDALFNHATIARDNNDFGPRIGLAWQLDERTTVRTGYGIYYSQDTGNPVFDMGRNFGARQSATDVPSDFNPSVNLDGPWDNIQAGSAVCSDWTGPCFAGLYTFANDSRRRTPYVQQYMFNIQRQLTDSMLFEVGYSGNLGRKLQRMYGFNTPLERSDPTDTASLNDRRPWGAAVFGRIQTIANVSNSNYNALAVKLQQRYKKGLTYLIGYTWGRSIDGGSAIRTQSGDNLFPASSYNLTAERGLSQFHTAHRATISVLYELPLKFQNNVLETVAGGWQLGSILTFSGGQPFNPGNCGDLNGNRQGNRGDATGISPFVDNPTPQEFFRRDPSDGRGPAAMTCDVPVTINGNVFNELSARQGNVGRNYVNGPGFANWDFSVNKNFRVFENINLQLRFESFNFSNHPQWNRPDTGNTSLNYGVITSARDMRTNQFALKLLF